MDYKFVDNETELTQSTIEFFNKPEYWKLTVGNAPKYFVHIQSKKKHLFGLSKFCAFKNITVEEYISTYRYKTDGGTTQKHIAYLTNKDWKPRKNLTEEVRVEFDNWITKFHPNYSLNNASFISITKKQIKKSRKKKFIDPKTLEAKLKLQRRIGQIGEKIAYNYEVSRLTNLGVKNAQKHIEHTSKINSGAGFDLTSLGKKNKRFIEVKSSLNNNLDFYITENEYYTLEQLRDEAFIYFVHITDIGNKFGTVFKILKNPIKELKEKGNLKPIAYKAILRR